MWDYRVGEVKSPKIALAVAVAASSSFPPFLTATTLKLSPGDFVPDSGTDAYSLDQISIKIVLSDGGVYDNLGLETVWKNYKQILVSDAGSGFVPDDKPWHNWASQTYRIAQYY